MAVELTCIVCPRGCHLHVDDDLNVTGNSCPRGAVYGKQEVSNPVRTLTSTVIVEGSAHLWVCPVKTDVAIPKGKLFEAMKEVNAVKAKVPVHIGDVLLKGIAGTEANLIATREILD